MAQSDYIRMGKIEDRLAVIERALFGAVGSEGSALARLKTLEAMFNDTNFNTVVEALRKPKDDKKRI